MLLIKDPPHMLVDGGMADKPAPASRSEVVGRANSLANKARLLLTKRRSKYDINPQLDSPLFARLPQELRDKIWQFVLEPPSIAQPAHFHIYDEVYDACTYRRPSDGRSETRAKLRKQQFYIALLMSCRRIYNEALHYLYDESKFTFVVFAGRPREYCREKYDDRCKSLGRLQDCEQLFHRIHNLTIIIQPGKNPRIDLYTARLQKLLRALEYGKFLSNLTLIFNWRLEIVGHDPEQVRRSQIVKALYPLQVHLVPRVAAKKCNLTIFGWSAEQRTEEVLGGTESKYFQLLRTISGLDKDSFNIDCKPRTRSGRSSSPEPNPSPCKLISWNPTSKDDKTKCVRYGADWCCLERGAFGEDNYALKQLQPMTRTPLNLPFGLNVSKEEMECAVFMAGYLLLLPISAPITASVIVKRKRAKGEWR